MIQQLFLLGHKHIKLFDFNTKKCIKIYEGIHKATTVMKVGKKLIFGCHDGAIRIWNSQNAEWIQTCYCFPSYISFIKLINENTFFVVSDRDEEYKLFDLNSLSCIRTFEDFQLTDSLDALNEKLAYIKWDHQEENYNKLVISNIFTGKSLKTIEENDFCLTKIISNQLIATGSENGDLKIWDISTGNCLKTMKGHTDEVNCIINLTDDKLASCCNKAIIIWNFNTGLA